MCKRLLITLLAILWGIGPGVGLLSAQSFITLTNPTPTANDVFGQAVAALGADRVIIGANSDDTGATSAGAAYLFSINGTLLTTILNPTPATSDLFGNAVTAVGTDKILIGAYLDDTNAMNSGAAHLFSTNGVLITTFINPTPAANDNFGWSVAGVGTGRVLIGAISDGAGASQSGAAYLFSTNGTLLTTFLNPTPEGVDFFGRSVAAVGNDRILIGADQDNTGATDAGATYLYTTNGTLLLTLTNPTPASSGHFGFSVAGVGPDRILVGAYGDNAGAGAAYLFSTNGSLLTTFTKPTPAAGDNFGYAVAAVGTDKVLIGALFEDTGASGSGSAYLFSTNGTLLAVYTNPTPASDDRFGSAVAGVGVNNVLIGAFFDDTGANNTGAAYLYLYSAPAISTQPVSQSVAQGSNATFSVAASGSPPPIYQWRFNTTNIAGATNNTFTRTNAQPADAGLYSVTVSNGFGGVISSNASLTVGIPPSIVTQPASEAVTQGSNAVFNVVANGTAPLTYQWRFGATPLVEATNSSYTRTNAQLSHAGNYSVVVSNTFGTATSSNAVLTVNLIPPSITTHPTNRTVASGATTIFTVVAQGSAPLSYLWRKGGVSLPGATNTTFSLTNVQPSAAGLYDVVVTNVAGSTTSLVAVLSVTIPASVNTSANGAGFATVETGNPLLIVHNVQAYSRTNEIDGYNFRVLYDPALFSFVSNSFDVGFPSQQWLNKPNQEPAGGGFTIQSFSTATNPGVLHISVRDVTSSVPERGTVASSGTLIRYQLIAIAPGVSQISVVAEEDGTFLFDTAMQPAGEPSVKSGATITNHARVIIALTNPPAHACLMPPASFPMQAEVSDPFGAVQSVEFYLNGQLLGQDNSPPYSFPVTNLAEGRHTLRAVSRENFSLSHTSALVQIAVAAGMDLGDLPAPYPTLLANNGARHCIVPGVYLGQHIDAELDGQPNANATGDEVSPSGQPGDEDGVVFLGPLIPGDFAEVQVVASTNGFMHGWIDFNQNGFWGDLDEDILYFRPVTVGVNTLNFRVAGAAREGRTFARFRFATAGAFPPSTSNYQVGLALDGEVEDYEVIIPPRPPRCEPTSQGNTFWVAFPGQYAPDHPEELSLCFAGYEDHGETGGDIYVDIPGLGFADSTSQNGPFALPSSASLGDDNDVVSSKGIFIEATADVVAVSGLSHTENSSDAFLALPTDALGREYIIQGFGNTHSGVPSFNGSQFAFVATSDNTTVTITPSVSTGRRAAGQPYDITLHRGQTYQLRVTNGAPRDLSGTTLVANQPIAVFAGHRCATIPDNSVFFCDYIVEQLLPVERASTEFVTMPLATRLGGDTFRFLAVQDQTAVFVNGVPVVTNLNRGQTHQQTIDEAARITSDNPILVTQYANSSDYDQVTDADPFMVIVPPIEMFTETHEFCVPGHTSFVSHYVNVVAQGFQEETGGFSPPSGIGLDGMPLSPNLFNQIDDSAWFGAQLLISAGEHSLSGQQTGRQMGVTVYGWGEYDSYGYPGGLFFPDVTPPTLVCLETNVTIEVDTLDAVCDVDVPDLSQFLQVIDACGDDIEIEQSPGPNGQVEVGTYPITLTATDSRGNAASCVITLNVIDSTGPYLDCPQGVVTNCASPNGTPVFFQASAYTVCTDLPITCVPPSGSFFPPGTNYVTCTAVNALGTNAICSFPVVVFSLQRITILPGQVEIAWTGPGVLETAPTVLGPWMSLDNAVSPFRFSVTNAPQAYFRIRCD